MAENCHTFPKGATCRSRAGRINIPEVMRSTTAMRPNLGLRESSEAWQTCWSDGPCGLIDMGWVPASQSLASDEAVPAGPEAKGSAFRWSEALRVGLGGVEPPTSSLSGIEG